MANKYYYLVSSLPYLRFARYAGIGRDRLLSECERWLTPSDLTRLLDAERNVPRWTGFNKSLKADVVEGHADQVLNQPDPLKMEMAFEKIRWDFLEDLETAYHFDLNWLMVYLLKIGINERLAQFEATKGEAAFKEVCEVAYE